ncbi:MAG: hypothetical protein AB1779_00920 [Candidatus Thermoplasmatota archaeon]
MMRKKTSASNKKAIRYAVSKQEIECLWNAIHDLTVKVMELEEKMENIKKA